jgi:phytoene dehydrogenase-like protein
MDKKLEQRLREAGIEIHYGEHVSAVLSSEAMERRQRLSREAKHAYIDARNTAMQLLRMEDQSYRGKEYLNAVNALKGTIRIINSELRRL